MKAYIVTLVFALVYSVIGLLVLNIMAVEALSEFDPENPSVSDLLIYFSLLAVILLTMPHMAGRLFVFVGLKAADEIDKIFLAVCLTFIYIFADIGVKSNLAQFVDMAPVMRMLEVVPYNVYDIAGKPIELLIMSTMINLGAIWWRFGESASKMAAVLR